MNVSSVRSPRERSRSSVGQPWSGSNQPLCPRPRSPRRRGAHARTVGPSGAKSCAHRFVASVERAPSRLSTPTSRETSRAPGLRATGNRRFDRWCSSTPKSNACLGACGGSRRAARERITPSADLIGRTGCSQGNRRAREPGHAPTVGGLRLAPRLNLRSSVSPGKAQPRRHGQGRVATRQRAWCALAWLAVLGGFSTFHATELPCA